MGRPRTKGSRTRTAAARSATVRRALRRSSLTRRRRRCPCWNPTTYRAGSPRRRGPCTRP
eukprot:7389417-Prymnesium_polylepis.1